MRRSLLGVLLALTLLALPALAWQASKIVVKNNSDWDIEEFYLSPTDHEEWGPDQLGDEILEPGDTFTLQNVPCDEWDIMIVDDEGYECVLEAVDLCGDHAQWVLTNAELESCAE